MKGQVSEKVSGLNRVALWSVVHAHGNMKGQVSGKVSGLNRRVFLIIINDCF